MWKPSHGTFWTSMNTSIIDLWLSQHNDFLSLASRRANSNCSFLILNYMTWRYSTSCALCANQLWLCSSESPYRGTRMHRTVLFVARNYQAIYPALRPSSLLITSRHLRGQQPGKLWLQCFSGTKQHCEVLLSISARRITERERELPLGGSEHQNETLLRIYIPERTWMAAMLLDNWSSFPLGYELILFHHIFIFFNVVRFKQCSVCKWCSVWVAIVCVKSSAF